MTKVWVGFLVLLCALSLGLSLVWMTRPGEDAPSSAAESALLLKDYGGRLAVFRPGESEPLEVYEVYTHLLPEGDVAALQAGIPVDSEERLDRLLEDFGA
ncbi:MAG TPA: hypothetical protein H9795_06645 [Candidatus Fournierella merdigallinarum]|nr:hypothetical protein [Candidatus Fournierella merdigallinarum]